MSHTLQRRGWSALVLSGVLALAVPCSVASAASSQPTTSPTVSASPLSSSAGSESSSVSESSSSNATPTPLVESGTTPSDDSGPSTAPTPLASPTESPAVTPSPSTAPIPAPTNSSPIAQSSPPEGYRALAAEPDPNAPTQDLAVRQGDRVWNLRITGRTREPAYTIAAWDPETMSQSTTRFNLVVPIDVSDGQDPVTELARYGRDGEVTGSSSTFAPDSDYDSPGDFFYFSPDVPWPWIVDIFAPWGDTSMTLVDATWVDSTNNVSVAVQSIEPYTETTPTNPGYCGDPNQGDWMDYDGDGGPNAYDPDPCNAPPPTDPPVVVPGGGMTLDQFKEGTNVLTFGLGVLVFLCTYLAVGSARPSTRM